MKLKAKIAILAAAVCLSFLEFSWIASCGCFVEVLKAGRESRSLVLTGHSHEHYEVFVTASLRPRRP
jgi:hypothetical protein